MKRIFAFALGLVFVFAGSCFSYETANTFEFPLKSYSRGINVLGSYNVVKNSKYHLGEDANAVAGTRVYAVANGRVMKAKMHTGYGGMYVIEHNLPSGSRVCSLYAHMNFATFTKTEGKEVAKGEYLGQIGTVAQNGGWGEHLHFGIRKGAYPSDPNEYVCGDWILGGYTACTDVIDDWHSPSEFIKNFPLYLPFRKVANVAWYPPNKSCVYAERWRLMDSTGNWMTIGNNGICYSESGKMGFELGDKAWEVIYGPNDINEMCSD